MGEVAEPVSVEPVEQDEADRWLPSSSAVASAKAFGSVTPVAEASASHAASWRIGSGSRLLGIDRHVRDPSRPDAAIDARKRVCQARDVVDRHVRRGADADDAPPPAVGRAGATAPPPPGCPAPRAPRGARRRDAVRDRVVAEWEGDRHHAADHVVGCRGPDSSRREQQVATAQCQVAIPLQERRPSLRPAAAAPNSMAAGNAQVRRWIGSARPVMLEPEAWSIQPR